MSIHVTPAAEDHQYNVLVEDDQGSSQHTVTAPPEYVRQLAGDRSPTDVIEASFRFLLDREPKDAILESFELRVIERYFPEYRETILDYLEA